MRTPYAAQIYRERAEECFRLAKATSDLQSRSALERLGHEMLMAAEQIEPTAAISLRGITGRVTTHAAK